MNAEELKSLVQDIVKQATELKNKHTDQDSASVNYACIFCQTQQEYQELKELTTQFGFVLKQTKSGPLFQIEPLKTISGTLKLLKIRNPDPTRSERGDADFTVDDYQKFKQQHLSKPNFKLMPKDNFEMIELIDDAFNVRVYFSSIPLDRQFNLN